MNVYLKIHIELIRICLLELIYITNNEINIVFVDN